MKRTMQAFQHLIIHPSLIFSERVDALLEAIMIAPVFLIRKINWSPIWVQVSSESQQRPLASDCYKGDDVSKADFPARFTE